MRILLIEDNTALSRLIDVHLSRFHIVDKTTCFKKAEFFLNTKNYDLLIVDLDSINGGDHVFCNFLKEKHIYVSVLFLTAFLTIEQKINCLECDVNYLIKPFNILELVAKAKNLLRKNYKNKIKKLMKVDVELDRASHKVYIGAKEVALNRKEYALLELFLSHSKQVFSRAMLAEKVWREDRILIGNTIETTLSRLRKKIGKNFIKTIKGVGYKMEYEI